LKQFVYVLKNSESPPKYYTGLTSDPQRRLAEHNQGSCIHTTKHGPWSVDVIIKFSDERRAIAFERYLKSGSGHAFARKDFGKRLFRAAYEVCTLRALRLGKPSADARRGSSNGLSRV